MRDEAAIEPHSAAVNMRNILTDCSGGVVLALEDFFEGR